MNEIILILASVLIGIGMAAFVHFFIKETIREHGKENVKVLSILRYPLILLIFIFIGATILKIKGII